MTECIVFWQRMLTPHMTELARQLALTGAEVHYIAEEVLSPERRAMGWHSGNLIGVKEHTIAAASNVRRLIDRLPPNAVHITQGVRNNGRVGEAQKYISLKGLRHYPVMEAVDLRGPMGWLKPLIYTMRFWAIASKIEGLLAIGERTPQWIARRSPANMKVIPFAYFLRSRQKQKLERQRGVFTFIFVGSLITLKRVDMLIAALAGLAEQNYRIEIIGEGPLREELERQANVMVPGRAAFLGTMSMTAAVDRISSADCLVLPSDHDGWGAVVSEAQINGTPVICSSQCGASGIVKASGFGEVFEAGNVARLARSLAAMLDKGPIDFTDRETLVRWANCLTAEVGAQYLLEIIACEGSARGRISPPWERDKEVRAHA